MRIAPPKVKKATRQEAAAHRQTRTAASKPEFGKHLCGVKPRAGRMRNSQEIENRSRTDGLSGAATSRQVSAREESQAESLAQIQSGAKR
jgi:hypothetical protein